MRVSSLVCFLGASHCLHVGLSLGLGCVYCALSVVFCNVCDFDVNAVVACRFVSDVGGMFWCFRWCFNWWLFEYLIGVGFSLCTEFCLLGCGFCPSWLLFLLGSSSFLAEVDKCVRCVILFGVLVSGYLEGLRPRVFVFPQVYIPYRERKFPGTSPREGGKEVVHLPTKFKFRAHDMCH